MSDVRVPRIVWIVTDDGGASVELEPLDGSTGRRLDALDEEGSVSVRFVVADSDTEGHEMGSPADVVIDILLDDDTESHAVRMRFGTAEDADAFRRRVLAAGSLEAAMSRNEHGRSRSQAARPTAPARP